MGEPEHRYSWLLRGRCGYIVQQGRPENLVIEQKREVVLQTNKLFGRRDAIPLGYTTTTT
jgi:hypothetical protein